MHEYGANHVDLLQRERARIRGLLERILQVAHNPDCFSCAEVRRVAHEALGPARSHLDDWAL
jgi:hypothetical protein